MSEVILRSELSAPIFLVGIGGIGMSGLAQLLRWQGYAVAGSDRGLDEPGKQDLYQALRQQGIRLYQQDGSGVKAEKPAVLVVSSAVESDNPDLQVNKEIPVLHRAQALAAALNNVPNAKQIAVAGSCGKTSVTGWIASALRALGEKVLMVNGGYNLDCENDAFPGNFHCQHRDPRWLVYEVDESDRSLSAFTPDYGVLLNLGTDHYGQDELREVFANFLRQCRQGVAVQEELAALAPDKKDSDWQQTLFADAPGENSEKTWHFVEYQAAAEGISFQVPGFGTVFSAQSGRHSAVNATAVLAVLSLLQLPHSAEDMAEALASFAGVRQRFEVMGEGRPGVPVINDYAHNPEKIAAALATARERFGSPLLACFQPHGFRPLQFMRQALKENLLASLQPDDEFILLPVYYAGGSASFQPTSEEVAADLAAAGLPVVAMTRGEFEARLTVHDTARAILVMGARDSSLRKWCERMLGAK